MTPRSCGGSSTIARGGSDVLRGRQRRRLRRIGPDTRLVAERCSQPVRPIAFSAMVLEEVSHLEHSRRVPDFEGKARDAITTLLVTAARHRSGAEGEAGITDIVTADRGFDEAPGLRRVDPLDELAVDQLLNA